MRHRLRYFVESSRAARLLIRSLVWSAMVLSAVGSATAGAAEGMVRLEQKKDAEK